MSWYLYALLGSVLFAAAPLLKRKFLHPEKDILFWSSVTGFLITLFLIPMMDFPTSKLFYLSAVFTGVTGVCSGILQVNLLDKKEGRTFALQTPIQVIACFLLFFIFNNAYAQNLLAKPINMIIAFVSLVVLVSSLQFIRKSDNNLKNLVYVVPVNLLFALMIIFYRMVMELEQLEASQVIIVYIMVHYFTVSMYLFIENLFSKKVQISISEVLVSNSLLLAVIFVFANFFLLSGVYLAPNPAFALAFNLLIPVWIGLYSLFTGRKDDASLKFSIIMLIAISLLVISSY